ncbi:transcription regulator HTH, apses-type DNA-binding domain-containing protein [Mycena alexandri]|uniref:Transcription regulator HTH, apses-type DNA-binding domain-containing protein n=1 Tax=Mycena alexandri TaxID=1745969 RepID=A0AAD6SXG4_9AGAR|nr:transcription regulator HTH, apses-type DNA-binding domain-containing protein [Mycena alexandri]
MAIHHATYGGIPVYEILINYIALMKRRSDSWLNATQILKLAGFDQQERDRILEAEVQTGEHEQVREGYSKFQGTWVPLERGVSLAKQYNCEELLRPLIEFEPAPGPALAPEGVVASITAGQPPATSDSLSASSPLVDESESDGSTTPAPSEAAAEVPPNPSPDIHGSPRINPK